jgi:hypothetical protein
MRFARGGLIRCRGLIHGALMTKTLSYRLFGIGKIPEPFAAALKREGLLLMDEGIRGSATYRDFRAPGKYSKWKRQWYSAAIALTQIRLVAFRYSEPIIDVPFTDERIHSLQFSLAESDALQVVFDASLFHDDWSGTIEYQFRTPQAQVLLSMLRERVV